jgi:hypothetical protein
MWRSYLFALFLLTGGFYEPLAYRVPYMDVFAILVLVGVPGALLIDAHARRRRGPAAQ